MTKIEPQTTVTLQEAMESLTVAEVRVMERKYGASLESGKISGTDLTVAVILFLEKRERGIALDWSRANNWTLAYVNGYFAPEPVETDEDEPESESGKGDTLGA